MPKTEFNSTIEDYLRGMFRVEERLGKVTTSELARELELSAAATSEMIRKLASLELVQHRKYHGAHLTELGRREAIAITRRHRLWEVFLIRHLRFGWDQVHDLADQLEHIRSDELLNRLEEFLDFPRYDPHGDPIPTRDGEVYSRDLITIAEMAGGEEGIMRRISDELPDLLRYAASVGLRIGTHVQLIETIQFDGSVRLMADDHEVVISEKLANSLFVERAEDEAA